MANQITQSKGHEMNSPKNTPILHMDSPTFADDLAREIGPCPHEITTPQFHRTDGVTVSAPSLTAEEWANLGKLPLDRVRQMGCQMWEDDAKGIHWLFPGEWYPHIPPGTMITSICGDVEPFQPGVTDDDIRFGALAYGFITLR